MINDSYKTDFKNNIEFVYEISPEDRNKINKENLSEYDSCKMIKLYAIDDILPGSELFFSYGENYWENNS